MKNRAAVVCMATAVLASFLVVGCDREVSHTENSKVNSDGSVKTKEKTVSQSPDGTITKTEESKTTSSATNKP